MNGINIIVASQDFMHSGLECTRYGWKNNKMVIKKPGIVYFRWNLFLCIDS
jgi:hypothetical protein